MALPEMAHVQEGGEIQVIGVDERSVSHGVVGVDCCKVILCTEAAGGNPGVQGKGRQALELIGWSVRWIKDQGQYTDELNGAEQIRGVFSFGLVEEFNV